MLQNRKWIRPLMALAVTLCVMFAAAAALADSNFAFDKSVTTLFEGETLQLKLIRQGDAAEGTVTYKSSAQRYATVDDNGLVRAVSKGEVTISASLSVGRKNYTARITLTIQRPVTGITVKENSLTVLEPDDPSLEGLLKLESDLPVLVLYVGYDNELSASCTPNDASRRTWNMSAEIPAPQPVEGYGGSLVALTQQVDYTVKDLLRISNHEIQCKAPGECILTIASTLNPEVRKQYHLLIVQRVRSIKITSPQKSIGVGGSVRLSAEISPDNADIKDVTWKSGRPTVATVDEYGVVTGVSRGSAEITATAKDGSRRSATYTITVAQMPTGINLNETAVTVAVGYNKTIRATVIPSNANNREVTWTSSDTSIARISNNGYITPVKAGQCTVTAACKADPSITATAVVTVTQPVTRVRFTQSSITIPVGESGTVSWYTEPADATSTGVTLTSENTRVATVDQDGTVHAVKRGETRIIARATDGSNRSAAINVRVTQPVTGVHMKKDTGRVGVGKYLSLYAELEPSDASVTKMSWYSEDENIAVVSGTDTKATVRGRRWGSVRIVGTTEDGGYTCSAIVSVGSYDEALRITDFYLQNNQVKMLVLNESDMEIERFYFTVTCWDMYGQPLMCCTDGTNSFTGYNLDTLMELESTRHGRMHFSDFIQPTETIGRMTMVVTSYRTTDGFRHNISQDKQITVEFITPGFQWTKPETETEEASESSSSTSSN